MTMYSFRELLDVITAKEAAARKDKDSWGRLHSVASELARSERTDEEILVYGRRWNMEHASIHGFRGILNEQPLEISFDPSPGITVLHGLNGSGKSSISDAIEVCLTGQTPSASGGTAGKAPLWDPVHLGRGSSAARVEITLESEGTRLLLSCTIDESGSVVSHTAEVEDREGQRELALGESWTQILASHSPVFAYAALERRVQLSKDLATYFEGLLALGGSFVALQDTIADRRATADVAFKKWQRARDAWTRELNALDEAWGVEAASARLEAIPVPEISASIDDWLESAGLSESGVEAKSIPSDAPKRLRAHADEFIASSGVFEESSKSVQQSLFLALDRLHTEAQSRGLEDGDCPVCETPDASWLSTLGRTVANAQELSLLKSRVDAAIKALFESANTLLRPTIEIGLDLPRGDGHHRTSLEGQRLLHKLQAAVEGHGLGPHHLVLTASTDLANWLKAEEVGLLLAEAIAQTDRLKQWGLARARAATEFVSTWRQEQALGTDSPLWGNTVKRVEELRVFLRKQRSGSLQTRANERVQELLADADLRLESLTVMSTKASMELLDTNDNHVELGMLSAGQRNAVLLAPLLASVDAGPFGFLVLDDPVHAFDELRIDRLAGLLASIAKDRRVIVLTHDERLKEHLAARAIDCDTRRVERDPAVGTVSIAKSSEAWDQLLTDARTILDFAVAADGSAEKVTGTVRALCRISLDNAVRSFVVRNAVQHKRDVRQDLKTIDAKFQTDQRMASAAELWPASISPNPVFTAIRDAGPYLSGWNGAVHGNESHSVATVEEVKAARAACKRLGKWK
ncbi:AAA family ATPase [Arthrobacter sp. VKM Ac-2550]|uniref:ATP-binding protein n=1 Tax=Crystallibacter permensis TaxID=1938888 RepID=UPI002227AE25|nr:AAA family ATPase [Arthrobacter sp. VKM Ac-2550]